MEKSINAIFFPVYRSLSQSVFLILRASLLVEIVSNSFTISVYTGVGVIRKTKVLLPPRGSTNILSAPWTWYTSVVGGPIEFVSSAEILILGSDSSP